MRPILIQSIPHANQRYETVGDYIETGGVTKITVSEMPDTRYELLVAIHELIEKTLVDAHGIRVADIDAFDRAFEEARPEGDESEPGDAPNAPYRCEHRFATRIERLLAKALGVDWNIYDRVVVGLHQ